ncbi:hypothetical protein ACFQL8_23195 [Streptomyces goshikiensis]|uniref:DUF7919 family protein n=1 Tax=Streptomyces goshikiensis TaxID=1942 RepID=UPI0016769950|nr:hypothetical protein [Streptomyces goshikiensis]GHD62678.1 hypothetical protein GCM10010336_18330 [Streptomyces goshikiensis]
MEYVDLSRYVYSTSLVPMQNLGWLGTSAGIQGGSEPPVTPVEAKALERASKWLSAVTLGVHECEFCPPGRTHSGNGEFHYYSAGGDTYAAPALINHYVRDHGYRPPLIFRAAALSECPLVWDRRADFLAAALADDTVDFELRCEAVVDIAYWADRRSLEMLERAACDAEISDIAGREIGISLRRVLQGMPGSMLSISLDRLAPDVRAGLVDE